MTQYDIGDNVPLTYAPTGYAGGTCIAVLSVTNPSGVVTTPSVTPGTTQASATVPATLAGAWLFTWTCSGAVVDVTKGQFDVGAPADPLYASLAQAKKRLGILDSTEDDELSGALRASCRQVEIDTRGKGTHFTLDATATTRRYYVRGRLIQYCNQWVLLTDDIGSTSGLLVNGVAVTDTYPENALALGRAIEGVMLSGYPTADYVDVTARWGWPSVPDEIPEAVLLRMHRLSRRKASPEGVAGFADMGVVVVRKNDPDYLALIGEYVRPGLA